MTLMGMILMGSMKLNMFMHSNFILDLNVDTERGLNQYQVQFKTFFNLYLNHSIISNEKLTIV
jgi:hypothetical protein